MMQHLSPKEEEVFTLIGNGITTSGIALRMKISHKTVESHKENIKKKLGIGCSNLLIATAARSVMRDKLDAEISQVEEWLCTR